MFSSENTSVAAVSRVWAGQGDGADSVTVRGWHDAEVVVVLEALYPPHHRGQAHLQLARGGAGLVLGRAGGDQALQVEQKRVCTSFDLIKSTEAGRNLETMSCG